MRYDNKLQELEYYIVGNYNDNVLILFNITYAIIVGTLSFATVYVIIPTISAVVILCICSCIAELYSMLKNTVLLIKNTYNGIMSNLKAFTDGISILFIIYYLFTILLNLHEEY